MRRMRPWIVSNQVILITDHSSLVALTNGKELKNMRQRRYAMDLSEFAPTIKHRAGALLHTADALSRCGYTKKHADSMVEQLRQRSRPLEQCSVEKLKPVFEEVRVGSWLRARVAAVETGLEERTIKHLHVCDKLELDKVMAKYVNESDEEEPRTVEMYDMVSLVRTISNKLSMQSTPGDQKEEDVQPGESKQVPQEKEEQEAQHDGQNKTSSEGSQIKIIPNRKEQIGEAARKAVTAIPRCTVDIDTIRREQEQQPVMAAVKILMYVQDKVLPK